MSNKELVENLLVVGNGFDKAHNLKTSYKEFIDFYSNQDNINELVEYFNDEKYIHPFTAKEEDIRTIVQENLWLKLIDRVRVEDDNWCALEDFIGKTIGKVQQLDYAQKNNQLSSKTLVVQGDEIRTFFLETSFQQRDYSYFEKTAIELSDDLRKLTFLLEKYLVYICKDVSIEKNKDIESLLNSGFINKAITFNYTTTLENEYINNNEIEVCHIHGALNNYNSMVFGNDLIDSFENTSYTSFQKFFQRITKQTNNAYLNWLETRHIHYAIFYGFSFGSADKDVIQLLLEHCDIAYIYYYDEKALNDIVANLTIIFGKDKLLEMTNRFSLIFCKSNDMSELIQKLKDDALLEGLSKGMETL